MRHSMSLKARRELLRATAGRYQKSSKKEKQIILDEFVAATNYHRKYAIQQLKNDSPDLDSPKKQPRKPRVRKYDRAQTPYQRLVAAEGIPETTKQKLKEEYDALDPVYLLTNIQRLQDLLWPFAYVELEQSSSSNLLPVSQQKKTRQSKMESPVPDEKESRSTQSQVENADRMYRRTKKKRKDGDGRRWWRTQADPFKNVWPEIEQKLAEKLYLNAKMIFNNLRQAHLGKFQNDQLRSLQRRVKQWRIEQFDGKMNVENPFSIPGNRDSE